MAEGTGGGAAYSQLTRLGNEQGEALKNIITGQATKDAAKKLADEREAIRKAADEASAWDNLSSEPEEGFTNVATGFQSVDNVTADYVSNTSQQYGKIKREGIEAWNRGDHTGYYKAQQSLRTLNTNYNLLNTASEVMGERLTEFNTLMAEGKVSPVDEEYVAETQAFLNKNFRIVNGANNVAWIEIELNKNGEKKYVKKTLQEFIENRPPLLNFDLEGEKGWINQFASTQGLDVVKKPNGLYSVNTQQWSERNQKSLNAAIKGIEMDGKKMSSVLYQATGLKKKENFTESDYNNVEKYLTERVMGQIATKDEKTLSSAAISWAKFNAEEEPERVYNAQVATDSSGKPTEKTFPIPSTKGEKTEYLKSREYTLNNKLGTPLTGILQDNATAEVLTLVEEGGNYYAKVRTNDLITKKEEGTGSALSGGDVKTTKIKNSEYSLRKLNDTELNLAARAMGLPNAGKLNEYLKGRDISGGKNKIKVTW